MYATRAHVPDYMVRGGTLYRLVTDDIGSVRLVVKGTTGEVIQRIDYDAFGQVISDNNPGFQPFGFAGGQYDPDTKLVRFGERDDDAETARWISRDPIGFGGGQGNLYAYSQGDPINLVDPTGLETTVDLDASLDITERLKPPSVRESRCFAPSSKKTGCVALEAITTTAVNEAIETALTAAFEEALGFKNVIYELELKSGSRYVGRTQQTVLQRMRRSLRGHHTKPKKPIRLIIPEAEELGEDFLLADAEATMMGKKAADLLDAAGIALEDGEDAFTVARDKGLLGNKVRAGGGTPKPMCP